VCVYLDHVGVCACVCFVLGDHVGVYLDHVCVCVCACVCVCVCFG